MVTLNENTRYCIEPPGDNFFLFNVSVRMMSKPMKQGKHFKILNKMRTLVQKILALVQVR